MDMVVLGVGAEMVSEPTPGPSSTFQAKVFVIPPSHLGGATEAWLVSGAKGLRDVEVSACVFLYMS